MNSLKVSTTSDTLLAVGVTVNILLFHIEFRIRNVAYIDGMKPILVSRCIFLEHFMDYFSQSVVSLDVSLTRKYQAINNYMVQKFLLVAHSTFKLVQLIQDVPPVSGDYLSLKSGSQFLGFSEKVVMV